MSGTAFHYCGERSVAAPGTDARRCAAVGWVGGGYPSAPLQARTAAFDGHCAFTRAARSAGLRFAVILLSKTMDVGRDHLIHRKRSPFPYEGKALTPLKLGRDFEHPALNVLDIRSQAPIMLSGLRSLFKNSAR